MICPNLVEFIYLFFIYCTPWLLLSLSAFSAPSILELINLFVLFALGQVGVSIFSFVQRFVARFQPKKGWQDVMDQQLLVAEEVRTRKDDNIYTYIHFFYPHHMLIPLISLIL